MRDIRSTPHSAVTTHGRRREAEGESDADKWVTGPQLTYADCILFEVCDQHRILLPGLFDTEEYTPFGFFCVVSQKSRRYRPIASQRAFKRNRYIIATRIFIQAGWK